MVKKKEGEIIILAGTNVWPHELETAKSLMNVGYSVKFIKKSEEFKTQSADVLIGGEIWEFKAPKGARLACVEKNLRRGKRQSDKIVFDSRRIKKIPDLAIQREILAKAPFIRAISEIKFVNRKGEVIDIYRKKR